MYDELAHASNIIVSMRTKARELKMINDSLNTMEMVDFLAEYMRDEIDNPMGDPESANRFLHVGGAAILTFNTLDSAIPTVEALLELPPDDNAVTAIPARAVDIGECVDDMQNFGSSGYTDIINQALAILVTALRQQMAVEKNHAETLERELRNLTSRMSEIAPF